MAAPSQFYVCNGQIPSETQDEGYTAFIDYMEKGAPNDKQKALSWSLVCTCQSQDVFA